MAKPTFAKLGLIKNTEVKTFTYNGQEIEVKQYLPIEEKLELIGNSVARTLMTDTNTFPNYIKLKVYVALEIVFSYTNLVFTEKQKEDLPKLYDLLMGNNIISVVKSNMAVNEYEDIEQEACNTLLELYKYQNSAAGIADKLMANYEETNNELANAQEELKSLDNLDLVKNIITKLG